MIRRVTFIHYFVKSEFSQNFTFSLYSCAPLSPKKHQCLPVTSTKSLTELLILVRLRNRFQLVQRAGRLGCTTTSTTTTDQNDNRLGRTAGTGPRSRLHAQEVPLARQQTRQNRRRLVAVDRHVVPGRSRLRSVLRVRDQVALDDAVGVAGLLPGDGDFGAVQPEPLDVLHSAGNCNRPNCSVNALFELTRAEKKCNVCRTIFVGVALYGFAVGTRGAVIAQRLDFELIEHERLQPVDGDFRRVSGDKFQRHASCNLSFDIENNGEKINGRTSLTPGGSR